MPAALLSAACLLGAGGCAEREHLQAVYRLAHSLPLAEVLTETALIDLGTPAARPFLLAGFSYDERSGGTTFCWSEGERSTFRFVLLEPRPTTLSLHALALAPLTAGTTQAAAVAVELRVNDVAVERWPQGASAGRRTIALPAPLLRPGWNAVELRYGRTFEPAPSGGERRRLGVAWERVEIEPAGGALLASATPAEAPAVLPDLVAGRMFLAAGTGLRYQLDLDRSELLIERASAPAGAATLRVWLEVGGQTADLGAYPLPLRALRVPLPLDQPSPVHLGLALLQQPPVPPQREPGGAPAPLLRVELRGATIVRPRA